MKKRTSILGVTSLVLALSALLFLQRQDHPASVKVKGIGAEKEEKGPRPDQPDEAMAYWAKMLRTPDDSNPHLWNLRAKQWAEAKRSKRGNDLPSLKFEEWGPGNFAGRIRAIAIKPDEPDTMLIGGVLGGVWKSLNGGQTWEPQNDFLPVISIGHLLVDPDEPNRVFAGTGEGFFNHDAARGLGIFVSEDFGSSWTALTTTGNEDFYYVNRLVRIPGSQTLLAATRNGVFRSTDMGTTWVNATGFSTSGRGFIDLKMDPSQPNNLLAYHFGDAGSLTSRGRFLWRSTDGGASFNRLGAAEGLPITDISRMEIGYGSNGTVYVAAGNENSSTRGLYKSTDSGGSFTQISTRNWIARQAWYDLLVAVDPNNSDRVYLGAVDLYRSTNGGIIIPQISFWAPGPGQMSQYIHADLHAFAWHPTEPDTLFIGSDGGIFKTTDGGNSWQDLNQDLRITQFYGLAVHPDGQSVIGGTQDNGTHRFFGDKQTWLDWAGGDGGYCAWDQNDPNFLYGSHPFGDMYGSSDGGLSISAINLPANASSAFIQPFTLDPNDGNRMIVGADQVYFSGQMHQLPNVNWQVISQDMVQISATQISPFNSQTAAVGNVLGNVWITHDLGTGNQWDNVALPASGSVTAIAWDPHDTTGRTIYVTLSNYADNRIWRSQDGGTSWSSLHGDLPQIPCFAIQCDSKDPNLFYLGTEVGLWAGRLENDGSVSWNQYNHGPAHARITDLVWSKDGSQLFIATHGRSIYRATQVALEVSQPGITPLDGDGDDYLDLGEHASMAIQFTSNAGRWDDVQATLVSQTPGLEVHSPALTFTSIAAGETVTAEFDLFLATLETGLQQANLMLYLDHAEGSETQAVTLTLGGDPSYQENFSDGAESENTQLTHYAWLNQDSWQRSSSQAVEGAFSWYAANADLFSDISLETPWMKVGTNAPVFSFSLAYIMEGNRLQYWDGSVLELLDASGRWTDVGGDQVGITYDGQLHLNTTLRGRHAWSGNQPAFRSGVLDLSPWQGETIKLRFRVAADQGTAEDNGGVWIDNIQATDITIEGDPIADTQACADCSSAKGSNLPYLAILPFTPATAQQSTTLSIVNPNQVPTAVAVFAFDAGGAVVGNATETLPANGKWRVALSTLFPYTAAQIAWTQIGAQEPVEAFAELTSEGSRSAYLASTDLGTDANLPHVAQNTGLFNTYLAAVNAGQTTASSLVRSPQSGNGSSPLADPHRAYQRIHGKAQDFLGNDLSQTNWAILQSDQPRLAAMEYFSVLPEETRIAALGLLPDNATTLRFLHIAADTSTFWTGMVYINAANTPMEVSETYFNAAGEVLKSEIVPLAGYEKITRLFDDQSVGNPVPEGAEWMQVEAPGALIGYELFGSRVGNDDDFFAGLQGAFNSGAELHYPHVENSSTSWTGLVALNVGNEIADLTFTLYSAEGQVLADETRTGLAPNTKLALLVSSLFDADLLAQGAWIKASASGSQFAGFTLWGDMGGTIRQHMAGIQAFIP